MSDPQRQTESVHTDIERTLDTLFEVARLWAGHGLRIAKSALETSARTLEAAAAHLGDLADRFA